MSAPKPFIVICDTLNSASGSLFEEFWGDFLRALRARARVETAQSASELIDMLKQIPKAVFIADSALVKEKDAAAKTLAYVRAGGRAILCATFGQMIDMPSMDAFFVSWGLSWKAGNYGRRTSKMTPTFQRQSGELALLHQSYSMKAIYIANAAAAKRVYVSADGDKNQASVVFDDLGAGKVGWLGDINAEQESTPILLWLAGLPVSEPAKAPIIGFTTFTVDWSPRGGHKETRVAIGRGGVPYVWHLLSVSLSQEARSLLPLSDPETLDDGQEEYYHLHSGSIPFRTKLVEEKDRTLFQQLSRAGAVDGGNGTSFNHGRVVSDTKEVILSYSERAFWCAGCGNWEKQGGPRFLACSACKRRNYCSTACQTKDWKAYHKKVCPLLKDGKEASVEKLRLELQ
ncbi:hypothetical protein BKA62DRAFT_703065 [Auriculariales sp. MPI-PUGE-AT-0066]|nr:hypothetical protein BKA62DRAFT_703065 [Auriculariales sp. MPI-PUGE-AT-0066]